MRIISQDGNVDIPYESAVLICEEGIVSAFANNGRIFCMGSYSTPEKALAVMEELRKKYEDVGQWSSYVGDYPRVFQFPQDEEGAP